LIECGLLEGLVFRGCSLTSVYLMADIREECQTLARDASG
jgi:hypothetical protein